MGVFISFEGIDGVGKSTQARMLAERLKRNGVPCLATREPGGTPVGREIRSLLLGGSFRIDSWAQTFLFLADRAQHLAEVIRPALANNYWVICDRFIESTMAYQGYSGGIDRNFINLAHDMIVKKTFPDVTFILDCSQSVAYKRLLMRGRKKNHCTPDETEPRDQYDSAAASFQRKLREAFLDIAKTNFYRYCVVNASLCPEKIHSNIVMILKKRNLWPFLK